MVFPGSIRPELLQPFRPPIVAPEVPVRETQSASFGDLVRMLAEGIADAQASLDRSSAEQIVHLANTRVQVVSSITETIDENGNITYQTGPLRDVSLLDLGVLPTFYQFSEAKVEVTMDIKIVENVTESGNTRGRFSLFADTAGVRFERKLNRDVTIASKLTATLVPVPAPVGLQPARATVTPPADTE
jgi:hypothetical protein